MRVRLQPFLWVGLAGLLNPYLASGQVTQSTPAPTPYVDERVELMSIIFRLAGNVEYHMDLLPLYSADIDRYFAPYKNHPCVQMAHALAEKDDGVGFDAVMSMAISLSPPPELKPLVTFSSTIPDKRWS